MGGMDRLIQSRIHSPGFDDIDLFLRANAAMVRHDARRTGRPAVSFRDRVETYQVLLRSVEGYEQCVRSRMRIPDNRHA
jgi:hypothetical protein